MVISRPKVMLFKQFLQCIHESALLLVAIGCHVLAHILDGLLLFGIQLLGHLQVNLHVEITLAGGAHLLNALSFQPENCTGLGACRNLVFNLAFQGGHRQLVSQRRLFKGDRDLKLQINSLCAGTAYAV